MHRCKILLMLVPFLTLAVASPVPATVTPVVTGTTFEAATETAIPIPAATDTITETLPPTLAATDTITETISPIPAATDTATGTSKPIDTSTPLPSSASSPTSSPLPFEVIFINSSSPYDYATLNANGYLFWIGQHTSAFCPGYMGDCPPDVSTILEVYDSDTTCGMDVEVPGGQQVYVAADGALSYTFAHSNVIPSGSFTTGFGLATAGDGSFTFTGGGSTGFTACPVSMSVPGLQIFAEIPGFTPPMGDLNDCWDFTTNVLFYQSAGFPAWEYD